MRLIPLLIMLPMLSACTGRANVARSAEIADLAAAAEDPALAQERAARRLASRIATAMDERQLAAQVIITGLDSIGRLSCGMTALLEECPAGGIIIFRLNVGDDINSLRNLIAESVDLISRGTAVELFDYGEEGGLKTWTVLPFAAVDHEGGTVNRFRPVIEHPRAASVYWTMAQNTDWENAVEQLNADSLLAGNAMSGLGFNVNFAPVVEHLNDDNREFLISRSYGPDPDFTAQAAAAFIKGMEEAGILCTVKHFPGVAGADPHYHPSVLRGDHEALDELAAPFAALIDSGLARAIMVSHSSVPALDGEYIASLSQNVMGGWLRGELGFNGIIVSDDFVMEAARGPASAGGLRLMPEEAAVKSLAAGSDMVIVWPGDLRRTHAAIMQALAEETLPIKRLRYAARRIIYEKLRMGLVKSDTRDES